MEGLTEKASRRSFRVDGKRFFRNIDRCISRHMLQNRREISLRVKKEKMSITIDSDIREKIQDLAESDDRSVSQYINLILRVWTQDDEFREYFAERQKKA